jgi:hypothetical protein
VKQWLQRHGAVIVGYLVGVGSGIILVGVITGDVARQALTIGGVGVILVALITDLAKDTLKRVANWAWEHASGVRPGRRRINRSALAKTRVLPYSGGLEDAIPRWVDPRELDHVGWFYGLARSPQYIPLYGNGLVHVSPIHVRCRQHPDEISDPEVAALIETQVTKLAGDRERQGKPFGDGPLVRLLHWLPPVDDTKLFLETERTSHRRVAAAAALLREDDGSLRRRFSVAPRELNNDLVCGALGVEVAVVTNSGDLVLARRGQIATDYRGETVVSIGRGLHPDFDAVPEQPDRLDPAATVARGVRDELGLEVDGRRTTFVALGLELRRMDPDLLGFLEVPYSTAEVRAAFAAATPKDRWETVDLDFVPFDPRSVAALIGGDRSLTPATPLNLVFSLLQRYEERDVIQALTT